MRKNVRWTWIAILAGFVMFFGNVPYARSAPPGATDSGAAIGYLENITFEKLKNKERVTLVVSRPSVVNIDSMTGNGIMVKVENMFVPEEFRRPWGEGKLGNIIRAVPAQKTTNGAQWTLIAIEWKERVPYSISQQGQSFIIDFNVAALESKSMAVAQTPSPPVMGTPEKVVKKPAEGQIGKGGETTKQYAGKIISLDFQDANIKAVLRLMAEEGGITIVSGDDVKGNVTVHMKKVPWDQALDTILDINGLTKKPMGNVIIVMTLDKQKKDEDARKAIEKERRAAEADAKAAEQKSQAEAGKLRQISIEAKIVEATDEFVRNLGIKWGGVAYSSAGDNNPAAITFGTSRFGRAASWAYPTGIPTTFTTAGTQLSSAAVNLPTSIVSPAIGLVLGGASGVLEAQLAALETTGQGKIISSPKITTMDGIKAIIKQGQQIPVVTPGTSGSPPTVAFKDALLRLEVKPKITAEGKISMEILASKDSPNYTREVQGNFPIDTNMVESSVVIGDGETIVIGGVINSTDSKSVEGVPWLSSIPVLGWLFKSESTTKTRRQLMIFVTPKIMKEGETGKNHEQTTG